MDRIELLKSVLGDEGYYCAVGIDGKIIKSQKFFETVEEVVEEADRLCHKKNLNAFFALGTFEEFEEGNNPNIQKPREAHNVVQMRSLFLDIDYGEHHGKPGKYATAEEAYKALKAFCQAVGLKHPYTISSGGGIHAYWPFVEPVSREEWFPVASQLKELTIEHGLHADMQVTADAARILRVPGTLNYKADEPRPVEAFYTKTLPQTLEYFKDLLGVIPSLKRSYAKRSEEDDEFHKAMMANRQSSFRLMLEKTDAGKGCAQLAHMYRNRANLSYNLWTAALSWAKCCVDGEKAAIKMSVGHPGFSPAAVESKMYKLGKPYSCGKIRDFMAEDDRAHVCTECPYWGKIKNPVALGREIIEADEEDNVVEDKPEGAQDDTKYTFTIPALPRPYFRAKNGGIFKRVTVKDEVLEVEVYHNDLYVYSRLNDGEQDFIVLRLHLHQDGVREFTIPMSVVGAGDEFKKQLASKGVIMNKADELRAYINASVREMQYQEKAKIAYRQFGWTDDTCTAFILGDKNITLDGNGKPIIEYNAPTDATRQLISALSKKGTIEQWQRAMEFYRRPGMEVHQFVIGLSFGSIFTQFTPINAALLHIYSPDSGLGKTTALQAAAGIWGDPNRLVLKETDTVNSKMLRAETLKNLIVLLDEVTNISPKDISEFVYPMTSGQQRNRMTASTNGERLRGNPWKLMMVSTGNASLMDKLVTIKSSPQGELKRILEVEVGKVAGLRKEETDELSMLILNNYGHAGVPYLQYIMQDINGIKELYKKTQKRIDERFNFTYQERFYSVLITDAVMGLTVARKAKLIDFKINPILDWLEGVLSDTLEASAALRISPEEHISDFWAQNFANTLRIKASLDLRGKVSDDDQFIVPDGLPRDQLVLRYEYDDNKLYIMVGKLREWCSKHQISYSSLVKELKESPLSQAEIKNVRMGKGTRSNLPAKNVLVLNGNGWIDAEKEKEIAEKASKTTEG